MNRTAGGAGLGSGVVTIWLWNTLLFPSYPMPAEVAGAVAPVLAGAVYGVVDLIQRLIENERKPDA